MIDNRAVLVGLNNPHSTDPRAALVPWPAGCTGHRLYELIKSRIPDFTRGHYLKGFVRRDLVYGPLCSEETAKEGADVLVKEFWGSGRTLVLLGEDVRKALCHPRVPIHPQVIGGCVFRQIPHPSGRNTWYNDPENYAMVAMLLEELYRMSLP